MIPIALIVRFEELEVSPDDEYFYNGHLFTGVAIDLNILGVKTGEDEFLNGYRHGLSLGWHENGVMAEKGSFVNNRLHGIFMKWNSEGKLIEEKEYINGQL